MVGWHHGLNGHEFDIRQTLTSMKGEINKNTIIVGDFNTPLTPIIVLLLISPFILVSICLTYCGAPMLGAYIFTIVISSSWMIFGSLYH